MTNQFSNKKQAIATAFSAVAATYSGADCIEQEIGARLLDKLTDIKLAPNYVLDLGCGPGSFATQLHSLFPEANIIGLDIAFGMLNFAKNNDNLLCCADAEFLPFPAQQFDLVFSNCCLPSLQNLPTVFGELQRILKPNGVFVFSTFGPATLHELGFNSLWPDLHVIGDILMQYNFKDPVVDMELIKFQYAKLADLCADLQQTGSFNIDITQIVNLHLPFEATFEVIYGMAIKHETQLQFKDADGNTFIPVNKITYLK